MLRRADALSARRPVPAADVDATTSRSRWPPGRSSALSRTCPIGDEWFAERTADAPAVARVDGREVDFAEAVEASAAILGEARLPLVCGLGQTDCESQRAAVALAEAIGAVIDPAGPLVRRSRRRGLAGHRGEHGHIRRAPRPGRAGRGLARGPGRSHPRLLPRLRLDRAGRAAERTLVVVDAQRTATAEEADEFIELPPELDFEALWAMRALVRDVPLDRELAARLPLDALGQLAGRLRACRYGAVLHGPAGYANALALLALVRDLARIAHVVALPLRQDGNARGAEDVLAWQTGYPAAVSFARGHPRARPGEFSAAGLLERGETDAALIIGFDALRHLPPPAADHLRRIPTIVVDPRATETAAVARVAFATAAGGVQREGTIHRMDGVPLTLRAPLASERVGGRGGARRDRGTHRRGRGDLTPHAAHRAGTCLRSRQRGRRRGARRLPGRRQGRRGAAVARPAHRRKRHGRDAGRGGHPLPHRRPGGQRGPQAHPGGAPRRRARPHRDHALGHGRDGARRRSRRATATRSSATRPSSTPPPRRSRRATRSPSCATRRSSTRPSSC